MMVQDAAHHTGLIDVLGLTSPWVPAMVLILTYAVLLTEKVNRTVVALIATAIVLGTGILDFHSAIGAIDFNTIALLTGMMIIADITRKSGVFEYAAIWASKQVRAEPRAVLTMIAIVTAVFSALLDNVTTVLLMVPIVLLIVEKLEVSPYPYLVTLIFASNIGGTSTLIGDPPNILIGSAANLPFMDFVYELGPVSAILMVFMIVIVQMIWGKSLVATLENRAEIMQFEEKDSITNVALLVKSLAVLALVIFGFIMAETIHLHHGVIAMIGASLLMLLYAGGMDIKEQTERIEHCLKEVEWGTIFFFIGLFVVVYGVEHSGVLDAVGQALFEFTEGSLETSAYAILWISAFASTLLDNIPFVVTMIPIIQSQIEAFAGSGADVEVLWWSLALGACLGGNGSLVGAAANVIVAGIAEGAGHRIPFGKFLLIGIPIMILSMVVCTIYLYLVHFA